MALGYNPKASGATVQYICNKALNLEYWTLDCPWVPAYPGLQTTAELSPKGVIQYPDGTGVTTP